MRKHLFILLKGELIRLNKYHVTTISLFIAFVWFVILYFIDDAGMLNQFLPMIIIIDTTMMSIMYIGAVLFFEKSEFTMSTMLVTPITHQEHIISKVLAITIETLLSSALVVLIFFLIRHLEVSWGLLVLALVLPTILSSLIGFSISYHTKDFTTLLVILIGYVFITFIPVLLTYLNIVFKADLWSYIFLIFPVGSALEITTVALGATITLKFWLSIIIIILSSILLFIYYVLPKYKTYAVKQSGV